MVGCVCADALLGIVLEYVIEKITSDILTLMD